MTDRMWIGLAIFLAVVLAVLFLAPAFDDGPKVEVGPTPDRNPCWAEFIAGDISAQQYLACD
jgi:hypothetical protein